MEVECVLPLGKHVTFFMGVVRIFPKQERSSRFVNTLEMEKSEDWLTGY